MTDLEVTKLTLNIFSVRFHELQEGEYTYIQKCEKND